MGTWGSGNFDSDTAADHLSILAARLLEETRTAMSGDPIELEADEYWGVAVPCNVELLAVIAEQGWSGAMVPDPPTVLQWKKKFLAIWESSIDGLEPDPEWKEERRAVIVATFDRLARVIQGEQSPEPVVKPRPRPKAKPTARAGAAKVKSKAKAQTTKSKKQPARPKSKARPARPKSKTQPARPKAKSQKSKKR